MQELGMSDTRASSNQTSLYWSLRDVPSSAGALALLPTAKTASEFGDLLFEGGVCPANIASISKVMSKRPLCNRRADSTGCNWFRAHCRLESKT